MSSRHREERRKDRDRDYKSSRKSAVDNRNSVDAAAESSYTPPPASNTSMQSERKRRSRSRTPSDSRDQRRRSRSRSPADDRDRRRRSRSRSPTDERDRRRRQLRRRSTSREARRTYHKPIHKPYRRRHSPSPYRDRGRPCSGPVTSAVKVSQPAAEASSSTTDDGTLKLPVFKPKVVLCEKKPQSDRVDAESRWAHTTFAADSGGKMASKFKRLMGIKSDEGGGGSGTKEPDTVLRQQNEMFARMEQQYEVARTVTHTMRGVGLGFAAK